MLDIEYKGANAVVFTTKKTRVVADPALSLVGLTDVALQNDVEITTEPRFMAKGGSPKVRFDGPGEYEVGDVSLCGVAAQRHIDTEADGQQATIYRLRVGELNVALIGNIAPQLTEAQLEAIGMVDIVILPVGGGGYTLDATAAVAVVRQLEPRAVIPVHYADAALTYEVPQAGLESFSQELGAPVIEAGAKWRLKGAATLPEQLSLVVLTRS